MRRFAVVMLFAALVTSSSFAQNSSTTAGLAGVGAGAALGAATGQGATTPSSAAGDAGNPKMVQVDSSYNGREVTLAIGEVVELSLAENPTTGFGWELAVKPEPACSLVKSWFEAPNGPIGRGGIHRWQFQAVRSGTGKIKLEYRRSWEKGTPPAQTFQLSVRVRKKSTTPSSATSSK